MTEGNARKAFFFEKKNQKAFTPGAAETHTHYQVHYARIRGVRSKGFLILSLEGERLFSSPINAA